MSKSLRLTRIKRAEYKTPDGRFTVVKDPTSGSEFGGWGYTSWCVFDEQSTDEAVMIVSTLRDARIGLATFYETGRMGGDLE